MRIECDNAEVAEKVKRALALPRSGILTWDSGRPATERNDCTVRALSNLSRLTYEQAHALAAKHGRPPRKSGNFDNPARELGAVRVDDPMAPRRRTLARWMPQLKRGFYGVRIHRHVFAVIDGQVIDTAPSGPRSIVRAVFKFPDPTNGN